MSQNLICWNKRDTVVDCLVHSLKLACKKDWERSRVTVGKRSRILGVSTLHWCPALETHCESGSARPVQALTLSRADSTTHCRLSFALLLPSVASKMAMSCSKDKSLWFKGSFEWSCVCSGGKSWYTVHLNIRWKQGQNGHEQLNNY